MNTNENSDRPDHKVQPVLWDVGAILLVVSLAVYMLGPLLFYAGWYENHDALRYLTLQQHFNERFAAGYLYPRWMPNLIGGYGYPVFHFYPPGFFMAALPFTALTGDLVVGVKAAILTFVVSGGVGAYLLGRLLFHRWAGLLAALLFLLSPYLYVNLFVRGALGELAAMMLTPWPIYFLLRLHKGIEGDGISMLCVLGIAATASSIVYCHPATSLIFFPVLGILAVFLFWETDLKARRRFAVAYLGGQLLALIWSAPYWHSVFAYLDVVSADRLTMGRLSYFFHFVEWPQFFGRGWGFGNSIPGPKDGMSFALGLPHFLLAVSGVFLARKKKWVLGAFGLYLLLLLLMTSVTNHVWQEIRLLQRMQFPWRLLSITAVLQVLCAVHWAELQPRVSFSGLKRTLPFGIPFGILVGVMVLLTCIWMPRNMRSVSKRITAEAVSSQLLEQRQRGDIQRVLPADFAFEWLPKTVQVLPKTGRGKHLMKALGPEVTFKPGEGHGPHLLRFEAEGPASGFGIELQQFYFPGWRVWVNGQELPAEVLTSALAPNGRIRIQLSGAGPHAVEAWYGGPPGATLRLLILMLMSIGLLAILFREGKRSRRPAQPFSAGRG